MKNPASQRNAFLENDDEERDLNVLTKFKSEQHSEQSGTTQRFNQQSSQQPRQQPRTMKELPAGMMRKGPGGPNFGDRRQKWSDTSSGSTVDKNSEQQPTWRTNDWRSSQQQQHPQPRGAGGGYKHHPPTGSFNQPTRGNYSTQHQSYSNKSRLTGTSSRGSSTNYNNSAQSPMLITILDYFLTINF